MAMERVREMPVGLAFPGAGAGGSGKKERISRNFDVAAKSAKHRLFVGLFPPPAVRRRLVLLRDELGGAGQVSDDRLHLTLFLTADLSVPPPASLLADLRAALGEVRAPAAEIVLTQMRCFPNGGGAELVPGMALPGLRDLHAAIVRACARRGIAAMPGKAVLRPHVTLVYRPAEPRNGSIEPIRWTAREIVLIHSHLGQHRHEERGRWTLPEQLGLL